MIRSIRGAFITGLFIILPLGVTLIVSGIVLDQLGKPLSELIFRFVDTSLKDSLDILFQIVSILIVLIFITILGYASKIFIGRYFLNIFERVLSKTPFVSLIYNTAKQIVDTFSKQNKALFQKVVLIEYPRKGIYAVGFLTNGAKGEIIDKTEPNLKNIFVPTTPNPTSGFLLMIPQDQIKELNMSVSDGMKLIISGGAVSPEYKNSLN